MTFTDDGRETFIEWVNSHHKELTDPLFPENLRGPWAKMEGYCARLALILQECRYVAGEASSEEMDEISVENAAALIDYFKSHARKVYSRLHVTREDKQAELALALLTEPSLAEAARAVGVGARTLYRWAREDSSFQEAYREARRQAVRQAVAGLQRIGSKAVKALEEVLDAGDTPPAVKVSAARAVLELGIKAVEIEDLAARVEALEAVIKGRDEELRK